MASKIAEHAISGVEKLCASLYGMQWTLLIQKSVHGFVKKFKLLRKWNYSSSYCEWSPSPHWQPQKRLDIQRHKEFPNSRSQQARIYFLKHWNTAKGHQNRRCRCPRPRWARECTNWVQWLMDRYTFARILPMLSQAHPMFAMLFAQ